MKVRLRRDCETPESCFGAVEQLRGDSGVGQVRFPGWRLAAGVADDLRHHLTGDLLLPVVERLSGARGVSFAADAAVRAEVVAEDAGALGGKGPRGGGADAVRVVGAGDDDDLAFEAGVDHGVG